MQKILICLLFLAGQAGLSAQLALQASRIYGGNSLDEPRKFALASNKTVHFFGGRSFSNDGDVPGNFGGLDFWIMKRSADGDLIWSEHYGGATNDELVTILPHPDGGAIGFGTTRSDQGLFGTLGGLAGAWLMRTNASGTLIDGRIYGSFRTELAADAFRHINGNITLAIEATSPVLDGQINHGSSDVWIVHVTPAFEPIWTRLVGGTEADVPTAIDADPNGNIYVGATSESDLPDLQPNQGQEDAWLMKIGPNDTILWQVALGGSEADIVTDIRYHTDGYVYAVVRSQSSDGDFPDNRGLNDIWIIRIDAVTGDVVDQFSYGGSGNDFDGHIDFFGDDEIMLVATTTSSDQDLTGNKGVADLWAVRIRPDGTIEQQMNFGGSANDYAADVIVQDSIIHVLGASTSSDKNVPHNTLGQLDYWYLALDTRPDSCSGEFICLPDTTLANELFPPAEDVLLCVNGCTSGYGPGPQSSSNACADFNESTAYFKVNTDTTADLLTLSVISFEFNQPQLALYRAVNCGNFQLVDCTIGADGEALLAYIEVLPLTTYVVAISDAEGNVGSFELCASSIDVEFCNQSDRIYATSTSLGSPLTGPFKPSEEVQFCYELTSWKKLDCNGFQGLMPTFGPGWDSTWFDSKGQPIHMDTLLMPLINHGFWDWYGVGEVRYNITNPVNGYGGGQGLPPGWYFTNTDDPPPAENPDQTTGDIYSCLPTPDKWKVCFTLKTVDECEENMDCGITMKTFADGEIGITPSLACGYDQAEYFDAFLRCCLNPNIESIQDFNICSGDTLTLFPETNLPEPVKYFWRADPDPFIEGASDGNNANYFQQTLFTEAAIPLGVDYRIWAESNGCRTDTEEFRITILPAPSGTISSTGPVSICEGGTVQLNFECHGTAPFVIDVYRDNVPFIQVLAETGVASINVDPEFSSRLRIGEVRDANCGEGFGSGFVDVNIRQEGMTLIDSTICELGSVTIGDSVITEPGMYVIRLPGGSENNCDSVVTLNLDVIPSLHETVTDLICRGDTIYVLDQPYYETTSELITYTGPEGCPNYIQLDLVVRDTFSFDAAETICAGDTLEFRGAKLYQAGVYSFVEEVRPMCFEETVLTLEVRPEIYVNDLAVMADNGTGTGAVLVEIKGGTGSLSYLWNTGQTTESLFNVPAAVYTLTVTDAEGCTAVFEFEIPLVNAVDDPDGRAPGWRIVPTIIGRDGLVRLENTGTSAVVAQSITCWSSSGTPTRIATGLRVDPGAHAWIGIPDQVPAGMLVIQVLGADGLAWSARVIKP